MYRLPASSCLVGQDPVHSADITFITMLYDGVVLSSCKIIIKCLHFSYNNLHQRSFCPGIFIYGWAISIHKADVKCWASWRQSNASEYESLPVSDTIFLSSARHNLSAWKWAWINPNKCPALNNVVQYFHAGYTLCAEYGWIRAQCLSLFKVKKPNLYLLNRSRLIENILRRFIKDQMRIKADVLM